jgi:hypothetical protein
MFILFFFHDLFVKKDKAKELICSSDVFLGAIVSLSMQQYI